MNSNSIENRLEKLGQEVTRLRSERSSGRVNFSEALRHEAVSLLEAGVSVSEVSRRGGMTAGILCKWRKRKGADFQSVDIVEKRSEPSEMILRAPSGWEVRGLNARDLIHFFQQGFFS